MRVKVLFGGLTVLPFLTGLAMAGQPVALSDAQMDRATAGQAQPLTLSFPITAANLGGTGVETVVTGTLTISFPSGLSGLGSLGTTIAFPGFAPGLPLTLTSTF